MERIFLVVLALALAWPAVAAQKNYVPKPFEGLSATIQRSPDLTPSVQGVGAGGDGFANYFLDDDGLGTVTGTLINFGAQGNISATIDATGFMGNPPGSYLTIRSKQTISPTPGQTAPGSTTTAIDWGVLTGWTTTGVDFCRSTPPFLCTFISRIEDASIPAVLPSTTYDFGTWTFDAAGNFEGVPYIRGTQNGGIGNTLTFLDGRFFGSPLPAIPLVGFGGLALSLAIAGGRFATLKRR